MQAIVSSPFTIRRAQSSEFAAIGVAAVDVYASLPGMPTREEQPEYYERLRDVATRVSNSAIEVWVAVDRDGELLGSVDFIREMKHYGSGGTAVELVDAAGMRLLAVRPAARGRGIGRALTERCVELTRASRKSKLVLHTTRAMQVAWRLYERMGFERYPEIDFKQGALDVFGFVLHLRRLDFK